jgi:hypothetical protein
MLAIMLSSYARDDTAEATWHDVDAKSCWRQCCRVVLVMTLLRRLDHSVMSMLSHAGNNAVESCSKRCCQNDLAAARYGCRVMLAMMLLSHVGDDATGATWLLRDVYVESYRRQCH